MDRRSFIRGAATAAAAIPLSALVARAGESRRRPQSVGYGPLVETIDAATGLPLLMLPRGFAYTTFGWRGDLLASGVPTPGAHDGMAAFPRRARPDAPGAQPRGRRGRRRSPASPTTRRAAGGTVTIEFDSRHGLAGADYGSLSGHASATAPAGRRRGAPG